MLVIFFVIFLFVLNNASKYVGSHHSIKFVSDRYVNTVVCLMSHKQVDTIVFSASKYYNFDYVSRCMFFLQRVGNQPRANSWNQFEVHDYLCVTKIDCGRFKTP